ncbi:MAG: serine/threonine-protein phosphatase [Spirochaetes bacterium]|nr:serine/threonine-protein phosphatase [Spirochaetota bacterium]
MENKNLKKQYYIDQCKRTLATSKIILPIAAVIIILFLYQDIYILHFDFTLWFRLVPVIFMVFYLVLAMTLLKNYIHYVIPLYTVTLATGIFMILGIAYHIFLNPIYPETYISNTAAGIQTVFIVLFLISSGAIRYLPLLFILPLLIFIALLTATTHITEHEWTSLSNPITTAFFLSLLAYITERRNFNDYILNHKIEMNEEILTKYKFTMEKDLDFASQLHRYIMPANPPTKQIAVYYRPYYNLGGDFYDFIPLNKTKTNIGIFVSDVTGHGISSAFITALLKHYLVVGKKYHVKPDKLLYYLNEYLTGNIGTNFVTALYCIVDFSKKELYYTSAAHYLPVIVHNDGILRELPKTGKPFPIGIIKKRELAKKGKYFEVSSVKLKKGSKIVLYTDGIIELYNFASKKCLDSTIFFDILKQNSKLSAQELVHKIQEYVHSHFTNDYINDDICVIIIEI